MTEEQYIELPALPVYEHILSAVPPRAISRGMALQFVLGYRLCQWASGWLIGVSIFFWSLGMNADLSGIAFRTHTATVPGHIPASQKSAWGSTGDRATYAYLDLDGRSHRGVSYGYPPDGRRTVTVEYVRALPGISRIAGMRTGSQDADCLGLCLVPLVGVAAMWTGLRKAIRDLRLLRRGMVATGVLKSGAPVGGRGVYGVTYGFRTAGGRSEDGRVVDYVAAGHLMNGDTVPVLYDPIRPKSSVPLGTIVAYQEIAPDGGIVIRTHGWIVLILPCLAILAYALGAYLRWRT